MGDRANIAIKQNMKNSEGEDVFIYFYTHWDGAKLPSILQSALIRGKGRWGDECYLSRIIFSEMIKESVLDETGYGISTFISDNGHDIIYVEHTINTVTIGESTWSFSEFVELSDTTFANY